MPAAGWPVVSSNARNRDLRLWGRDYARDPFPVLAELRERGPLAALRVPMVGRVHVTTTHAATAEALKCPDLVMEGCNVEGTTRPPGPVGVRWWMANLLGPLTRNMLSLDEPEHRRLRQSVDHAFKRRDVLAMTDDVNERARRAVCTLPAECDLLADFAQPFPLAVIADLLGVSDGRRDAFARASRPLGDMGSGASMVRALASLRGLLGIVREELAEAPGRPGLIGELAAVEDGMDDDERVATVFLLLLAGFETTSNAICNAVVALEAFPAERDRWLSGEIDDRRAAEELLRFASPVHGTKPRYVARDTVIAGEPLFAGEVVMPWVAAANADPAMFAEPDTLDLARFPNPHLVFGSGIHFCLGLQLARIELLAALRALYEERGGVTILEEPHWNERIGMRRLSRLPVRLGQV